MRLIHCSDFHLCNSFDRSCLDIKRFFGWSNWVIKRGRQHTPELVDRLAEELKKNPPDVLAITGDLSQLGRAEELKRAGDILYRIAAFGVLVLYVPGNHDRYTNDEEALKVVDDLCASFGGISTEEGIEVLETDDARFILLSQAEPGSWYNSRGRMPHGALEKIDGLIEQDYLNRPQTPTIVLGHYPVRKEGMLPLNKFRSLEEEEKLYKAFQKLQPELYLCGHIHHPFELQMEFCTKTNPEKNSTQLCAGSLTAKGSYYEIDINDEKTSWSLKTI